MGQVAGLLLEWAARGQQSERGIQISLALTREEIAHCIGTTRESVNRILHTFQQRLIIDAQGSILTILDLAALEGYAGA